MDSNTKKVLWDLAGKAGLILGLISTASMAIGQMMAILETPVLLNTLIGTVLWAAETGGCIYFMYMFMKKFAATCPEADNRMTFKMGTATAFLSALVYSTASFANLAFISADYYSTQFQILMEQMAPMMDSNTAATMEKMLSDMPQISFVSNLIYCFIFGTVVSAVLSRNIPDRNPFNRHTTEQ